ncbi:MAG: RluA family pseudouridine synthase [Gammaproteobacteria bacterium]|nr:MAG: RluA family pseudouridine synthase [Gammaproteobacteria bacterium]
MKDNASTLTIDAARDGQRIDNFLFTRLKGVPKGLIYRLLRTGKIRVNGKRIKQTYRLQEDDEVKIPNISISESTPHNINEAIKNQIEASTIYEDDDILAINKPAGLAVHPGSMVSYGVIEVLRAIRPDAPYLELVHRIDRETSGCLLIAKNKHSLNALHDLLRREDDKSEVEKIYILLVKGRWDLGEKVIDTPLQSKGQNSDVDDQKNAWKDAYTIFRPIEYFKNFTLLNAEIKTGRTHQIRLHAAQAGFPIIGDSKHGDFALNKEYRKKGFKRMFLHAAEISFQLPNHKQRVTIAAPMGAELMTFMKGLDS